MEWYEKRYKLLFLIPILLLVASIAVILITTANTGSFVQKGVSLKGGVSATATFDHPVLERQLANAIEEKFPQSDIQTRSLGGDVNAVVIDAADINEDEQVAAQQLQAFLESNYDVTSLSLETTGPSLGEAFFEQTIIGILLAFLWMGWVVYLYFGDNTGLKFFMGILAFTATILGVQGVLEGVSGIFILALIVLATMVVYFIYSVPSGAVILAAASTIIFTLAVIDLLGVRLSTAGVAAFLMLIGYSVDTDILLSTRVLKGREDTLYKRILDAFKTGITMQVTTTVAVLIALIFTTSEVIRQIMLIIFIGMIADVMFTWLQNAGILYWHQTRRMKK